MKSNWYCKYKLAHRGLHNDEFPENSLGAFANAIENGFAIELDVRTLKDGNVVVFHDEDLKRMCGENINLNTLNLSELNKYPLLDSNFYIPTLSEVLELINGQIPVMIELKPVKRKEKLESKVFEIIKNYSGEIAIKSFNPFSVIWFKKHAPHIPRGVLSSFFNDIYMPKIYKVTLKKLKFFRLMKPDFISYDISNLPNKFVTKHNVPVIAWTVRSEKAETYAMKYASNIVFENYIPKNPTNY